MTNGKPGRSQPPDRLLCKSVPALRSPTSRRSRCFFSRDANNCALLGYRLPLRDRKFADLYGSFSVKWFFGLCRFLVWSGKAVPRPVACDQVRGARGKVSRDRNASVA
jgi:hypothetical protein